MAVASRPLIGWQTLLADLSLILFMVTAAAQADAGAASSHNKPATPQTALQLAQASPLAEPLAVYRLGGHAPPLGVWLKEQGTDPRQLLTIMATYSETAGQGAALSKAGTMAAQAQAAGQRARLIVEPGARDDAFASLAFDAPERAQVALAHGLQGNAQHP